MTVQRAQIEAFEQLFQGKKPIPFQNVRGSWKVAEDGYLTLMGVTKTPTTKHHVAAFGWNGKIQPPEDYPEIRTDLEYHFVVISAISGKKVLVEELVPDQRGGFRKTGRQITYLEN